MCVCTSEISRGFPEPVSTYLPLLRKKCPLWGLEFGFNVMLTNKCKANPVKESFATDINFPKHYQNIIICCINCEDKLHMDTYTGWTDRGSSTCCMTSATSLGKPNSQLEVDEALFWVQYVVIVHHCCEQ